MSKLYSIQMLRGLAAIAVVVDHVTHYMHKSLSGTSWLHSSNIYNVGGFGVDLFFCISGFIMVITTNSKPSGIKESISFLEKRFLRIYPTYWLYCIITLLLPFLLYGKTDLFSKYDTLFLIQSFLLLPARISEQSFSPFLGQGWTLQYELYFYIVFAISLFLFKGWRVVAFCSLSIISLLALSQAVVLNDYVDYLTSNTIVIDFIMGMISGLIYLNLHKRGVTIRPLLGVIAIVVIITAVSLTVMMNHTIDRIFIFGFPSFVIVTIFSLVNFSMSLVCNRCLIHLGEASYTIYLAHMAFIWLMLKYSFLFKGVASDMAISIIVLMIVVLSYVMYLAFEKPLTNRVLSIRRKHIKEQG